MWTGIGSQVSRAPVNVWSALAALQILCSESPSDVPRKVKLSVLTRAPHSGCCSVVPLCRGRSTRGPQGLLE